MKVLFYSDPQRVHGGAETYWRNTALFLEQYGLSVRLFSFEGRGVFPYFPLREKVEQFRAVLAEFQPDIIHLNKNLLFAGSVFQALKTVKTPVVATVHDYHSVPLGGSFWQRFKRRCLPFYLGAQAFIIPSIDYYQELKRQRTPNILHIPHFIDSGCWLYRETQARSCKKLLFVGRLEVQKGVWVLLQAMLQLVQRDPAFHLTIIGEGSQARRMRQFIAATRMEAQITLAGGKTALELPPYFIQSDLLLMPSLEQEMFGLVGLEAQASGLPVLASQLPGIREWCRHGISGWTVPPGDARSLAAAVQYLSDQPLRCEALRRQARRQVELEYSPRAAIERLINLYRQFISSPAVISFDF